MPLLLDEERVTFKPNLPPAVNRLLQAGVAANGNNDKESAGKLFWQAQREAPECLETYFALYKFYFYDAHFAEAEHAAQLGLQEAARQAGLSGDWQGLAGQASDFDFYQSEATLFYLYTLKALAFIKLRQYQTADARRLLAFLDHADPQDRSGWSTVASLAQALEDSA